jgi:hypothetical protein
MPDLNGSFVPTTNVWDVSEIVSTDINSDKFKELLVRLYQNINTIAVVLNSKDTGYYVENEFTNGQLFFPNPALTSQSSSYPIYRNVVRYVVDFGALPNAGSKSVAHPIDLNTSYTFTRIYGCASDTTGLNYIPIPYASPTLTASIELSVDATNVTITTGSNRSNFNVCYVILEYLTQ